MRLETLLPLTSLEPRPYQLRVVKKAVKMYNGEYVNGGGSVENAAKSIMIESPTGSGKTPMGLLIARMMQENNHCDVAWICMRRNLLTQAANENAPKTVGNPRGKNIGVVADYISMFQRELPGHLLPHVRNRKLLLVHDEAAHDAANTMAHVHNELQPDYVLGLSATPYRTDRVKLCFEKVVRDIGIRELIAQGWLSQYDHYSIPDWEPETVADFYAMDPTRWGASLMFFHQQHHCRRLYRRLTEHHGIPGGIVTGNSDREQQARDLAEGRLAYLVNCAVLTEGFDMPDMKSVFVRDSGRGCSTQMAGRVFRKSGIHPVKQVIQSRHTQWSFLKTAMPIQQWVWENGEWLTLKINPLMSQVSMNARYMIATSEMEVPQFIRDRAGKKKRKNRF